MNQLNWQKSMQKKDTFSPYRFFPIPMLKKTSAFSTQILIGRKSIINNMIMESCYQEENLHTFVI